MALDLLRLGFYTPNLSDSERAAFGLEFATVAAKVLATEEPVKKLLTKEELAGVQIVIDHRRLLTDVEDVMTKTVRARDVTLLTFSWQLRGVPISSTSARASSS